MRCRLYISADTNTLKRNRPRRGHVREGGGTFCDRHCQMYNSDKGGRINTNLIKRLGNHKWRLKEGYSHLIWNNKSNKAAARCDGGMKPIMCARSRPLLGSMTPGSSCNIVALSRLERRGFQLHGWKGRGSQQGYTQPVCHQRWIINTRRVH